MGNAAHQALLVRSAHPADPAVTPRARLKLAREATPPDEPFEAAFRALFATEHPSLYRYLDRTSGDPQLAADLAQEAFIRLYRRGSMPDVPRSWLVSVANNLLRDERRRVTRRLRLLARSAAGEEPESAPNAETRVIADERRRAVRAALDRLPERERRLLLLRHEGYSYRELAVALELNPASVGTLLARARSAFRAAVEEGHLAFD